MGPRIEVIPRFEQGDIGPRLGKAVQCEWVLDRYDRSIRGTSRQSVPNALDGSAVETPYRWHVDDLSFDELDAVVLTENAGLAHAFVVYDRIAVAVVQTVRSGRHWRSPRVDYARMPLSASSAASGR
jgi:hypothetical protein